MFYSCALVISTQQLHVFQDALQKPFARYLADVVRDAAPGLSRRLREQGISQVVRHSLQQAVKFGITEENNVELLLYTMVDLGIDFDSDPQFAWAGSILYSVPRDVEYVIARDLYRHMTEFRQCVYGEDRTLARTASQRVLDLPVATRTRPATEDQTFRLLNTLHPERFQYAGDASMRKLLDVVDRNAGTLLDPQLDTTRLLRASVMFLLGQAALLTPNHAGLLTFTEVPPDIGTTLGARRTLEAFLS